MENFRILISGKPTGRLASKIYSKLTNVDHHDVSFCTDIFDISKFNLLTNKDVFIATAWNTKGNYKEDPINEEYATTTNSWLDECKRRNVFSIYLGTSDNSGFEDCLYHRCKNKCDSHADTVLKIPYVWQPSRKNSLAWKISNGEPYELVPGKFVYTTEDSIVEIIQKVINRNLRANIIEWDENPEPLETWVSRLC